MTRRVFALASAVLLGLSCTPAPVVSADECANVVPKAGEVWTRQDYNFQGGTQDLSKLTCAPGYQFSCNGVAATPATDGDHGGCVDVNLCYHRNGQLFWYPNMALTIGSCIPIECPNVVPKAGEVWTRQDYNFQGGSKDLSKLTCSAGYTFSCNGSPATPAPDADHYGCSDAYLCYHHNTTNINTTVEWYPNMAIAIGSCMPTPTTPPVHECANVVPKAGEVWTRQDYNFQGGKQDLSKLTCAPGYQFSCNGVAASPATDGDHGGCVDVNLCYHRNGQDFWYPNMALTIGSCIPIECPNVVPKAGEVWTRQDYNFQGGKQDLSKLTCAPGYQFSCNGVAATPVTDGDHGGCVDVNLCYHRNGQEFWYPNMALTIGSCIPIECPDVVPKAGEVWTRQQYNFQGGTKDLSKLTCSAGYTFSCNGSPATPAPDADHYGCSDAYLCYHHNSTSGSGGTTSWYPNMAIAIGSCVSTGAGTL